MIPGISEADCQRLVQELNRHPAIKKVILFGSRAMGNFRPGSDIDLALVFDNPFPFNSWLDLQLRMDELELAQKIDLVDLGHIHNQDLIDHILRAGKVISGT